VGVVVGVVGGEVGGLVGGLVDGGDGGFVVDGLVADGSLVGALVVGVDFLVVGVDFLVVVVALATVVVGATGATVVSTGGGRVGVVVLEEVVSSLGTRRRGSVVGGRSIPPAPDVARSVPANRATATMPAVTRAKRAPAAVSFRVVGARSAHR